MRNFFRVCAAFALAGVSILSIQAEPVINEFMASNLSTYPDNCDFDDYSDWIELYNPAGTNVALKNYFLTDDLTQPFKWLIPTNAVITADGYLMFRADGFDAAPGETHLRGFWPWGSTFVTRRYHTGFKLSADGEELGLFRTTLPPQEVTLIAANAIWKYLVTNAAPVTNWTSAGFSDAAWPQGAAQLGFGDGDETTTIGYGGNANNKNPTTYFRGHFNVNDPARVGNIRFRAVVDDGAVFHLNGTEFARLRMNTGTITYSNYANANPPVENAWESVELPRALLVAGDNVLAVEVHQVAANSSDLSWAGELVVSETTGPAILVDSVSYGPQTTDVSYGRDPASTNGWSFFGTPTPEAANATEALTQRQPAPAITASLASGFYAGAQTVALSGPDPGPTIRYTLDGSVPGLTSTVYSNAISINSNTILRARAFVPGWIPGPILTRSYFVDEPADRTLPVMSFVVDPPAFFDRIIGIYTNQASSPTSYPHKGREVPVRVEFFETNQTLAFAVNGGVRIGGENNWPYAQKPLNIHMRGKYGDDVITYPIFQGEPVGTFGKLNVRNGGDTWATDMLRDAMMAPILRGQAENDPVSYRPTVVFLNGRYWGIQDIRKMFDPVFFANEHQLEAGSYDYVLYAHDYSQSTENVSLMADAGTIDAYEAFHAFYTTHPMSQATNYSALTNQMEVDSFIDYVVINDFGVNTSWPWNREFWRGHAAGSKWLWNTPDLDRCFDTNNVAGSLIDDFRTGYPLFAALTNSPAFVNRLLQRYAAQLGSTLCSNRMTTMLDAISTEVEGEMPRHIARWAAEGGIPSMASRQKYLDRIKTFIVTRPPYALSRLQTELGLSRGLARLAVNLTPGGNLRIAGVPMTPQFNTNIALFKNTPVELTAEPAPGWRFAGWSTGSTNATIELTLTADQFITANFIAGAETILPSAITADTTLSAANSPYTVTNDLIIPAGVTLTVQPGVKFLMPPGASIYVHGAMNVNGTSNSPVQMLARGGQPWGNLCFVNATGSSVISNLFLRGSSPSRLDPVNLKGGIASYNSTLTVDGADIEALLPITARFGVTTVRNSRIHILFTGDCINVKNGAALVENNTLIGTTAVDTDGIDFDSVDNGLVRGNRIYAFNSVNGDAVDLGFSQNVQVISNRIFNIYDKGISVGQGTVVHVRRNLIVGCGMGIGIKDAGSTAHVDQNTFARNTVGIAAYVKIEGRGGGTAFITNCIFSRSKDAPVTVDSLSSLTVTYSLSDTLALPGGNNLLGDPLFTDAGNYDFSLTPGSPAINSGDPSQPPDPDGTRPDMGACYQYNTNDYPYLVPNLVVVNEVLAHSHDSAPDWIELHNNSAQPVDLGGWYLSDDPAVPMKFRIADGTLLPGNGYAVFYEDRDFGAASTNAGALIPFALSENGDSVNLFGPGDGLRPDYSEKEDFGASPTGVPFGRYFKTSSRTYNFVAMSAPTPGAANSAPLVGPVVISEIMYHPPVADAEYLELANITSNPVTLYDLATSEPWAMTQGITHQFPTNPPLTLAAHEKIVLARNASVFAANYPPPPGTRVFQWASGALDNNGETLELSKPGDVNSSGARQYIRVDRVDYSDSAPWPTGPDGNGAALTRIDERAYGNDFINWAEATPTPGQTSYQQWTDSQGFSPGQNGANLDPDGDGLANALEYALGTGPLTTNQFAWHLTTSAAGAQVAFDLNARRPDVSYYIQKAANSSFTAWTNLPASWETGTSSAFVLSSTDAGRDDTAFYRLAVELHNQ